MSAGEQQDSSGSREVSAIRDSPHDDPAVQDAEVSQPGEAGQAVVPASRPDASSAQPGRGRHTARGGHGSFLRELPVLVLVAFVLALLIKTFLVQAFWIPSESMERTLLIDDRVLVNKVVYQFRDVHRGEVVVFNGEGTDFESRLDYVEKPGNLMVRAVRGLQGLLGLGAPSEKDFIKRVIGVGGDTVACCDDRGRVTVNGQPLDEPYVYEDSDIDQRRFEPVTVPKGQLWLMGDHRRDSSDSRAHGPVPEDKVVGRAFVKVWPLSRLGLLQAPEGTFGAVPAPASGSTVVGAPEILAGVGLAVVPALVRRRRAGAPRFGGQRRRDDDSPKAARSWVSPKAARSWVSPKAARPWVSPKAARPFFLAPPEADSDVAAPPEADSDVAAPPEADSDVAAPPEARGPGGPRRGRASGHRDRYWYRYRHRRRVAGSRW